MIKINLATRKQAAASAVASPKGGPLTVPGMSNVNIDMGQLKGLPIRKVLLPVVVGIAASWYLDSIKDEEIQKVDAALNKVNAEKAQLTASVAKMKGYEELKKAIEADELSLRTKIDTIQRLVSDRGNPPKVLRSLATAIPKDVWLSEFRAGEADVTFRGFSLDFSQVSDFMKNLGESAYFSDLTIRSTQQARDETGLEVASFELAARRR